MKLSVIIVSWNVKDDLLVCLRSLYENCPQTDFETIVVDNASTDGTIDAIKRQFPQVWLIVNKENRGFSAANNQGIKTTRGEYIILLNPDTIVHPQSLDDLVKILDQNPNVGACGPKLLNEDGTVQPSTRYFPTFRAALYANTIFKSLRVFRKDYQKWLMKEFNYSRQIDVEQISGVALMVR